MPRFFSGDENGFIKSISCSMDGPKEDPFQGTVTSVAEGGKNRAIQRLAVHSRSGDTVLAAARADGTLSAFNCTSTSQELIREWTEDRFNIAKGHQFIGLSLTQRGVFSCSSAGHFRLSPLEDDVASSSVSLPTRLCELRISSDGKGFAYGGDEVDLSVWDVERALSTAPPTTTSTPDMEKKRKKSRSADLMHGETWRAKNLPNDSLSLRQPVHITTLTYLEPHLPSSHLLTGTKLGEVRRYDTRAARRPVANWKDVAKIGGIKTVQSGLNEHEVFVSDHGSNLYALDLRSGRTIYGYKGISGAINSISPALPSTLASTSLDRYFRYHSSFPPPDISGQNQAHKGAVLGKVYLKSVPTCVIWDGVVESNLPTAPINEDIGDDDEWEGMQSVDDEDSEDEEPATSGKRSTKKRKIS